MSASVATGGDGLARLLRPRSVALVGASGEARTIRGRLTANLLTGYTGTLSLVAPRTDSIGGHPTVASLRDLPAPPDLVVVAAPASAVPAITADAVEVGAGGLLIVTAGFAEIGPEGAAVGAEVMRIARAGGLRVIGPNCVGLIDLDLSLRATFLQPPTERPGGVVIVCQSGAIAQLLMETAYDRGMGVSHLVTTGNEADVTVAEVIAHFVDQPSTRAVLTYLESLNQPDVLLAAGARGRAAGRPVVAYKAGRSELGAKTAVSHTGARAVEAAVVEAAFERYGILSASSPADMIDLGMGLTAGPWPAGGRVAVLTGSGAFGVMLADELSGSSGILAPPGPVLEAELKALLPDYASLSNPFDVTAGISNDADVYVQVLEAIVGAPDYDIVCLTGITRHWSRETLARVGSVLAGSGKPSLVFTHYRHAAEVLVEAGIPVFSDPNAAGRALRALLGSGSPPRDAARLARPAPVEARAVGRPAVQPGDGLQALRPYGISVPRHRVVASDEEARAFAAAVGGPCVAKIDAPWLPHRSEHGAVVVGLADAGAVVAAVQRLRLLEATLRPPQGERGVVSLHEMVPAGTELACAALRDATLGPIVSVGLGGVLVEVLDERVLGVGPIDEEEARRLVGRVAGGRLVTHRRGLTEADVAAVAKVLVGLYEILLANPTVTEVECNPVIVGQGRAVASDLIVAGPARPAEVPA